METLDIVDQKPAERHMVELAFDYKRNYARQTSKAEVRNISLTGALIRIPEALLASEKINIFMTVQGRTRKVSARVVWSTQDSAGVEFQPFNNRDLQIVDDIIYYATQKTSTNKNLLDTILNRVA